jgi:dipeptidyl aminopeptidase/acylaminoacyl peptidase
MDVLDAPLAFSPDSTQLVFSRSSWDGWNSGPPALMAINVAGGGSVPLAQSGITGASVVPNDATQVQWSPDGNWVAYAEPDSTGNYFQKLEVAGDERARCACARRRHVGSDSTDLLSGRKLDYEGIPRRRRPPPVARRVAPPLPRGATVQQHRAHLDRPGGRKPPHSPQLGAHS